MSRYSLFNISITILALTLSALFIRSRVQFVVVLRTALTITLLSYPWDFFAIHYRAWSYEHPGPKLLNVPINDLLFIFSCTLFSASLLTFPGLGRLRAHEQANHESGPDNPPECVR